MNESEHGYDGDDYPDDEPEDCWACGGEGYYHDCGEDCCCCAEPEVDDMWPCEECNGTGRLR